MNSPFLKFFVVLSLVTGLLILIYALLIRIEVMPAASYALGVFATQYSVTLLIYFVLLKALSLQPQYFVQIAILSIVVKLIIYGAFNFVVIYLSPAFAIPNVILFFLIYLIFTPLAVAMLYPVINKHQREKRKPH